ncbi:MAG: sigma-54-dependent Fis family transcriptional regulator [Deltaproteobacteria bacterium]|nr:sigma-54-dependent Fis family transcriptional regulator [Deltaproteobacteria bacterium]
MKEKRILIIDDELSLLESLEMFLKEKGYAVACAQTAAEGLNRCRVFDPQVIILDVRLPDLDGLDVLRQLIRNGWNNIIIITAFHDMDTTIKAMKGGAFEYLPKPIDVEELESAIDKAIKSAESSASSLKVVLDADGQYRPGKVIGQHRSMKEIFKSIGVLSENRVTVLIEGETGTGKELIAKAIHGNSPFQEHPFQTIDCSTIVGTLLESELFGHEKGAFTGASGPKRGKFELAGQGTIFLDEIGEIPFPLQAKMLRFLQEKEFERLGGEKKLSSKARVIAATNRDLGGMVKAGTFREDLYYRLNVAVIKVPPLRERKADIPLLVEYMLGKINRELGKRIRRVEESALKRMMNYYWPGNVRELENTLIRVAIHTRGEVVLEDLVEPLLGENPGGPPAAPEPGGKETSLKDIERGYILDILQRTHWHLGQTCAHLGISRPTLRTKLREYGLASRRPDDVG